MSEAERRRDEGMHRALSPDPLHEWKVAFEKQVISWAKKGYEFTSEDVTDIVGLPNAVKTNRNNAVGAMMRRMALAGVIVKTGEYVPGQSPQSHGRVMPLWRQA